MDGCMNFPLSFTPPPPKKSTTILPLPPSQSGAIRYRNWTLSTTSVSTINYESRRSRLRWMDGFLHHHSLHLHPKKKIYNNSTITTIAERRHPLYKLGLVSIPCPQKTTRAGGADFQWMDGDTSQSSFPPPPPKIFHNNIHHYYHRRAAPSAIETGFESVISIVPTTYPFIISGANPQ